MSLLEKMFGRGKKGESPTPAQAINGLRETEEMLIKKQEYLEGKIEQEITLAKKHGTKNKRRELHRYLNLCAAMGVLRSFNQNCFFLIFLQLPCKL